MNETNKANFFIFQILSLQRVIFKLYLKAKWVLLFLTQHTSFSYHLLNEILFLREIKKLAVQIMPMEGKGRNIKDYSPAEGLSYLLRMQIPTAEMQAKQGNFCLRIYLLHEQFSQ